MLNGEHSAFAWVSPGETLAENRLEPTARADGAEIETPPLLQDAGDGLDDPVEASDPVADGDIDDEAADAILAALEALEARLSAVEDGLADPELADDGPGADEPYVSTNEPVHGVSASAELSKALDEGMKS